MKKFTISTCLSVLLAIAGHNIACAQRIMVTYAGTGTAGFSGDWGAGKAAQIQAPNDVCMDAAQNIYFVDENNGRIRMVAAANGVVTTIAGGGTSAADGIPAIGAALTPNYMCIDASGNLYVSSSNKIRKIDLATGIITTIAGISTAGFTGDGGPAIAASLNGPLGVCVDLSGNVYFVDQGNNRIRKVTAATGVISTIGGNGTSSYSGDGGPALAATMSDAYAIAADAAGDVFFSDQGGNYIREIVAATGMMQHIAGIPGGVVAAAAGGPASTTAIGQIYGLHMDRYTGDLYGCDGSCSCVRIDRHTGNIYLEAGSLSSDGYNGDNKNSINEYLNVPGGLCVDAAGDIYIADNNNNRMRKAIQLTHTPSFAFGAAQYINACPSGDIALDSQLTIVDIDSAQPETWTVVSAPVNGMLTGFPYSMLSLGTNSVVTPTGVNYTPAVSYRGLDSFRVQVSDGSLSSVITVYVAVGAGTITGPTMVCAPASITLTNAIQGGLWSATNTNVTLSAGETVTGVSAGSDVIQYAINTTCGMDISSSVVSIALLPPAAPGTISGPANVCAGSSIAIADSTEAGTWSFSNPGASITTTGMVTGVTAGNDTAFYTVANGCGSTAASEIITVSSVPDAGTISSETNVCIGSSITLTDGVAGGLWSAGGGHAIISSTGVVIGITAGTTTILYSVTNSCGTTAASQEILVNNCTTSISNVSTDPGISVFPNPAMYSLNISWTALLPGNASVLVTDVTSREVIKTGAFDNNNGAGTTQINIAGLNEGVYFLTFNSESAHFTSKFVVTR